MDQTEAQTRPLPAADAGALQADCEDMLDWLGTIDMPVESVGLREAAGNICGLLIGFMTTSGACFYAEESGNIITLCGQLKGLVKTEAHGRILKEIGDCAQMANDAGTDITISLQ